MVVLASALATLSASAPAFAQAPTFNAFISTPKGGESWFQPASAAVGDFNGDGKQDAIVSDGGPNLRLMVGNGNGTFAQSNVSAPATNPNTIRSADFNGDGRLDAVTVSNGAWPSPVTVLLNLGNDAGGTPQFGVTNYLAGFNEIRSVAIGNLNGDGRPDFVVGNAFGNIRVFVNNGNGTFTAGQLTQIVLNGNGSTSGSVSADFNGDGTADYLVSSNQSGMTALFLGTGSGTLQTPTLYPSYGSYPAVGDLNKDGKLDFATVNIGTGMQMVYLNGGGGTFTAPTLIPTGLVTPSSQAFVDINGDGNLDAVMTDQAATGGVKGIAVFLGNGAGGFGAANFYSSNQVPFDVSVADFNGDGKADISTVGYNDRTFGVLTNTTVFTPPVVTVFASGISPVTAWNPIFPAAFVSPDSAESKPVPTVGYDDPRWTNPHPASVFAKNSHPWEHQSWVPSQFKFDANWINAWGTLASNGMGGPGQSWTKYSTTITGAGDFVLQFLADNASWIYIDGELVGFQDYNWSVNGTGRYTIRLTGAGPHELGFIIWDGGGLAGGKFRIETVDSFQDNNPGEELPPPPPPSDVAPPVISAPADITVEAMGPGGSFVNFTATAIDDVDGSVDVVANPVSGSLFPIGGSTVVLTAVDAAGNEASATFNVTVQDTIAPVVNPQASIVAEATSAAGAAVTYPAATATDAVGVVSIQSNPPSGSTFPLGSTTVTSTARDAAGNTGAGDFTVTVVDTTAPAIASVAPSQGSLWPPNHRMVGITLTAVSSDVVGVTSTKIISVTSSESDNGLGDGDTAGDFVITGAMSVNLRAERAGKGNGRTYTITVEARDAAGNASTKTTTVFVPKSQGK